MAVPINKLSIVLIFLCSTFSILKGAEAQQEQTGYKYGCTITSPPAMIARWVSQRGSPDTVIMLNKPSHTVYFLRGMENFTADPSGLVSWTYENMFTHERTLASFDNKSGEMILEKAHWQCNYQGPGP